MFQCWSFNLILVFELFLGQLRLSSTQLGLWNCHAWLISSKIEKDETWNEGIEGIIGFYNSVCTFCLFDSCVHWCSTPLELALGRCCPQRVWTCWNGWHCHLRLLQMFLEGMISSKPWTFKELGTSSEFWRLDLGMCFWNINDYTNIKTTLELGWIVYPQKINSTYSGMIANWSSTV